VKRSFKVNTYLVRLIECFYKSRASSFCGCF